MTALLALPVAANIEPANVDEFFSAKELLGLNELIRLRNVQSRTGLCCGWVRFERPRGSGFEISMRDGPFSLSMIKILLPLLWLAAFECHGATPSIADLFEKAAKKASALKDYGSARKVEKGAQPELVVKGSTITFNGKQLVLGQRIEQWQKIIGKGAVCARRNERPLWCKWDGLGIEIAGSFDHPAQVAQINVRFNRDADEGLYDLRARDAQGNPIDPIWLSKGVFPGYLEFDGFGIDKHTRFWEIQANVDRQRNLRCGLLNCHQPHGTLGDTANVYMVLNSGDKYGELREFTITSGSEQNR
ncbi:hypothetical protein Jab_2c20140 [Janthinobacterium sp. HH01]|uniref:DUF7738 domain-containing protein n=1 Tax=Janthinobacterium sp. HH01 TaxID=1198452 RepID=UPI0002AE9D88|nr:hypothetical protein [Janthinobacterium sp. HH01]ELX09930.1 hypothetical protein Jab_2c20140 [Janthinobacterium sp. HH01]